MARMTDEEAEALDEKWTRNPPRVGPNGTGFLALRAERSREVRMVTAQMTNFRRKQAGVPDQSPAHRVS